MDKPPRANAFFPDRRNAKRKVIGRKYTKRLKVEELESQIEHVQREHNDYVETELEYLKELVHYYHEELVALQYFVMHELRSNKTNLV